MKWLAFVMVFLITCCTSINETILVEFPGKLQITAEIADSPSAQQQGLMYRSYLPEDRGMLFIFPDEQYRSFWMKNMEFPIDIIFVSAEYVIVDIKPNAQPCVTINCEHYNSVQKAKYVIEVNANTTVKNNIVVGDSVIIKNTAKSS